MKEDKKSDLEKALIKHGKLARKVMVGKHLDFDALYALAFGDPSPEIRLRTEAHLTECGDCRMQLDELRHASDFIEKYESSLETNEALPDEILQSIPKVKEPVGAFVRFGFDKDNILAKVEGVVKSMGGMVADLSSFIVEVLAPDTEFLRASRGPTEQDKDYRINYGDYQLLVATFVEDSLLEISLQWAGKNTAEMKKLQMYLVGEDDSTYQPDSTAVFGDTVKLVFKNLDLNDKSYELRFGSEPVAKQDKGRPIP